MYCPRCSQQQASEDLRFCSRCGLPLALISEVLAHGGSLPQLAELDKKRTRFGTRNQSAQVWAAASKLTKDKNLLTRRNGLIFSLFWFMFFVLLLTPIFAALGVEEMAALTAIVGTIGSLMFFVASFVLLKRAPRAKNLAAGTVEPEPVGNLYQKPQAALPPEQSIPVSTFPPRVRGNWRDTNDLVQPSVTEGTTKLLEKDER